MSLEDKRKISQKDVLMEEKQDEEEKTEEETVEQDSFGYSFEGTWEEIVRHG